MQEINLNAVRRIQLGREIKKLRRENKIPAIVYGHKVKNEPIFVNYHDFEKVFRTAGKSTLIWLLINGDDKRRVLISDWQMDPVTDRFVHIDFYQVRFDEKITTRVPLKFVGEAGAVKNLGGILVKNMESIEIRCLPQDLPREFVIDLTPLATFEDAIRVKDLKNLTQTDKIEILTPLGESIVTVIPPRTKEELAKLEEKVVEKVEGVEGVVKPEVEEKGEEEGKEEKETKKVIK